VGLIACAYLLAGAPVSGQTVPRCPYGQGIPVETCTNNPHPDPIPTALGGHQIGDASCSSTIVRALASLYSYDDPTCRPANTNISPELKYIGGASDYLPSYYKSLAENGNFHGTLYCDNASNTLVLAYRGSVQLTPLVDRKLIADWWNTNILQHIGFLPLEYGVASDAAQLILWRLAGGDFDGICGPGRPKIILAGHSKGGGQAQYAAFQLMQDAVVFNSDLVNPIIFRDWVLTPDAPAILQWVQATGRTFQSMTKCFPSTDDDSLRQYYARGNIIDVRMVNDPFAKYFLPYCSLPHADIEWLSDTLTCSVNDGHAIDTVVRELKACAPPIPRQP